MEIVAPSGPMQVHETARSAGCYTFVEEHWFYDDVIDPAIVRDIQVFDPRYFPLLCRKVYLTPAGTSITVDYHVVGRYIENPTDGYENENVDLEGSVPARWQSRRKKIQPLRILQGRWPGPDSEGGACTEWRINAPPPVVRPDRWLVEQLHAVHKFFDVGAELTERDGKMLQTGTVTSTMDRLNQIQNAERERDARIQEEAISEARYRMRENWPQLKRAADEGRWTAPPQEPKPFVDLGVKR